MRSISPCPRPSLRRLARDQQGATAVMMALAMTVLIGFAGIAVDIGAWQTMKRSMQGAADQAAYSAAIAALIGGSPTTNAKGVMAQMGFVDGQNGVTVTVNNPPASGSNHTNTNAWEVIATKPQPMWFSHLFLASAPIAGARAVAIPGSGGTYCILTLGQGPGTIALQGSPEIDTPNCDIQANSTSSSAVTLGGSAKIVAHTLSMVGNPGYQTGGSARISANIVSGAPTVNDPYAGVTIPSSTNWLGLGQTSCQTVAAVPNHSTTTLNPGCYTGTISVSGTLALSPGTYYIDRGTLTSSNGTITGTGVTIILTSSTGSNYSTVNLSGNSTVNLTAESSGSYSGLVIYEDRNAPAATSNTLGGGSSQSFSGALYFPSSTLNFGGNASTTSCTQVIAYTLNFSGHSSFNSSCAGVGTTAITGANTYVAE